MANPSKFEVCGYEPTRLLAEGSFAACFLASHAARGECCVLVAPDEAEFAGRLALSRRLRDLRCVQELHELVQVPPHESSHRFAAWFRPGAWLLSGKLYKTGFERELARLAGPQQKALLRKLVAAAASLHARGVFHMDLKPSNIFVEDGEVVLIDFGEAVEQRALLADVQNTSAYAPTHDVFARRVDPEKFDVFCLGSVIYEAASGHPPSQHAEPFSEKQRLWREQFGWLAADLFVRMLAKDQADRYSLAQVLEHPYFSPDACADEQNALVQFKLRHCASPLQSAQDDCCLVQRWTTNICTSLLELAEDTPVCQLRAGDDQVNVFESKVPLKPAEFCRYLPLTLKRKILTNTQLDLLYCEVATKPAKTLQAIETLDLADDWFKAPARPSRLSFSTSSRFQQSFFAQNDDDGQEFQLQPLKSDLDEAFFHTGSIEDVDYEIDDHK